MSAIIDLPRPIGANNIFANVPGKGRVKTQRYKTWRRNAENVIMAQGKRPHFAGPVRITLFVGEAGVSKSADLDGTIKAYLDVLVHMGIIPDDKRAYVRSLSVHWIEGQDGAEVLIEDAQAARVAAE